MTYRASQRFTCVSCDDGIIGEPVFHVGLPFCCAGCAAGGPCQCSYDQREEGHDRQPVAISAVADGILDDTVILDEPPLRVEPAVAVDEASLAGAVR